MNMDNWTDEEAIEMLNNILVQKHSVEMMGLFRRRLQLHNMYPDQPVECWDLKHAEELFDIDYQLDEMRRFQNI